MSGSEKSSILFLKHSNREVSAMARVEWQMPSDTGAVPQRGTMIAPDPFYSNSTKSHSDPSNDVESFASIESPSSKPPKRKRQTPSTIPAGLTKSQLPAKKRSNTKLEYGGKGKGKGKGKANSDIDTISENGSNSSGASVASRMLRITSRDSSRASSVASTTPSVESSVMSVQPSPTITRQANATNIQKPVMYHTHSGIHHHGPPRPSVQIPNRSTAQGKTSQPGPSPRTSVMGNSPVTRSNCRFRKISMARDLGGPRVFFILPGCSLGDKTLMDEEEIEDHGDATTLDHERMIGDIENLDFPPELVGVLRQLVGVDLLRENEVFFLPQPGESYHQKSLAKSRSAAQASSGDLEASGSQKEVIPASPSSARAPNSTAGSSLNTAGSMRQRRLKAERRSDSTLSHTDDDTTEPEEEISSQTKRRRRVSTKEHDIASSEEMPPPTASVQSGESSNQHRLKARRSKKLGVDALDYQPDAEAEGNSTDAEAVAKKGRRKSTGKKGVKRTRTSEHATADDSAEQPPSKRRRPRASKSLNALA